MPGKKKFIEKKKSVTYRLVPRCQLDPDGDTSEHVLVPVNETDHEKFSIKLPESALPPSAQQISSLKTQIPVKGPRPDWDPDIVAALDDDFNYGDPANALEDDFIAKANGPVFRPESADDSKSGSEDCSSDGGFLFSDDENLSFSGQCDGEEKSRFTQYSLTSAVTNCTREVQTFNEIFEKFCEGYDDDQIGSLDFENIEGYLTPDSKIVQGLLEDFEKHKKKLYLEDRRLDENMKGKILHCAEQNGNEKLVNMVLGLPPEYDCESIISTYSNKYNHPTSIEADKKKRPEKISVNLWKQKLTKSNLKRLDREAVIKEEDEESVVSENETVVSLCNIRPKDETPEQRRLRKQAIRQLRKENRSIKKENKLRYKEEKKKQTSIALNEKKNRGIHLM